MPGVLPLSPFPILADPNNQVVQTNATVVASGSQVYTGFGNKELNLVINIKASPTGTTPTLTYALQEVDPGDGVTLIGSPTTGAALNSITTQTISIPLSTTGAIKVSWTITGAGASFTQVFATLVSKISSGSVNVTSGSLTANQGTAAAIAGAWPVEVTTDGVNVGGTATHPIRIDPTGSTTQPVSGTVAATQSGAWTVAATQSGSWAVDVTDRAARLLGVIYGSQGVQIKQTATNDNLQVEVAVGGTLIDPRSIRALTSSDVVTSVQGTGAAAGAPWSVELSDGAAFYTGAKTGQFPAALVGGRLDENVGSWLGSTAPTVGSKTSANSVPVVIASDQSSVAVTAAQSTAANLNALVAQGAGSGSAATFWYVRVTDGTNTMPTADVAARKLFIAWTDGTNTAAVKAASTPAAAGDPSGVVALSPNSPLPAGTNALGTVTAVQATAANLNVLAAQGAPNTLANKWPVQMTDGTNTMPTADVAARALYEKITDGTNTAAVKASTTPAAAVDPALVVALSPNFGTTGNFPITFGDPGTEDTFGHLIVAFRNAQVIAPFYLTIPQGLLTMSMRGTGSSSSGIGTGVFSSGTTANSQVTGFTPTTVTYTAHNELWVAQTASFTTGIASSYQRIGIYNAVDGFSWGYNGTTFGLWLRYNGVDTFVAQASWNVDPLSGAAHSKFTRGGTPEALVQTNINLYRIRYGWLGIANVTFEVLAADGNFVIVHVFKPVNAQTTVSISNPNLPLTVDISNTAGGSNLTVTSGCWVAGTTAESAPADIGIVGATSPTSASLVGGSQGGTLVGIAAGIDGTNELAVGDAYVRELLETLVTEVRKMNLHLSVLSDLDIQDEDVD